MIRIEPVVLKGGTKTSEELAATVVSGDVGIGVHAVAGLKTESCCVTKASADDDILELPRIVVIDVFRKKSLTAIVERRPVGIRAHELAEIRILNRQDAVVIEFVSIDHTSARILDRPDHSRHHCRSHLQAGCILVRSNGTRLVNRQLAAVPESICSVSVEQHT